MAANDSFFWLDRLISHSSTIYNCYSKKLRQHDQPHMPNSIGSFTIIWTCQIQHRIIFIGITAAKFSDKITVFMLIHFPHKVFATCQRRHERLIAITFGYVTRIDRFITEHWANLWRWNRWIPICYTSRHPTPRCHFEYLQHTSTQIAIPLTQTHCQYKQKIVLYLGQCLLESKVWVVVFHLPQLRSSCPYGQLISPSHTCFELIQRFAPQ